MTSSDQPFSLLVSDLHLSRTEPALVEHLYRFLDQVAPGADALYVLGDLFEVWLGDDTLADPLHTGVCEAFARLANSGTRLYFMHGNRDFLIGQSFATSCAMTLLDDPALVDLHGTPTLLMHGDSLCTDDAGYMAFRQQVRNPLWQQHFLSRPLAERIAMARDARAQSQAAQRDKTDEIMDVNADTVATVLRTQGYPRLIHGHTHRPMLHQTELDSHLCQRWVLPDWRADRSGWLRCTAQSCGYEDFSGPLQFARLA